MTREEELYNHITWYAIKNWKKLSKKASHWQDTKYCIPIPISVQLSRHFKVSEMLAGKIARNVALMKNIGIVFKEE